MSRLIVVRRLTALIALLAILCLALPAAAAPGTRGQSPRTRTVHSSSLVDQFLSWIGTLLPGQSASQGRAEKVVPLSPSGGLDITSPRTSSETDRGSQVDPNG
jgi:hypothetical protein